jgi:ribosomal-protein-alanine N-acetyltransferase
MLRRMLIRPLPASLPAHPSVRLVSGGARDAELLAELDQRCFTGGSVGQPWSVGDFRSHLSSFPCAVTIAMMGGHAIGYVLARETGNIDSLCVLPEAQGHRVGQRLLAHAVTQVAEAGAPACDLQVHVENQKARSLYRKCGFEVMERLPGYYQGQDGLEMRLSDLQSPGVRAHLAELEAARA